jgi:hypothetical protein
VHVTIGCRVYDQESFTKTENTVRESAQSKFNYLSTVPSPFVDKKTPPLKGGVLHNTPTGYPGQVGSNHHPVVVQNTPSLGGKGWRRGLIKASFIPRLTSPIEGGTG